MWTTVFFFAPIDSVFHETNEKYGHFWPKFFEVKKRGQPKVDTGEIGQCGQCGHMATLAT